MNFIMKVVQKHFEYWDLRNQNNQEVAPGMYFYTIEDLTNNLTQPYVGKFVIIR